MTREEATIVACGNKDAEAFVLSFVAFCHMLDDIVDGDKPVDDMRLVRESLALIDEMMLNPWVNANRIFLWPSIVGCFNAWIDANKWERDGTPVQQRDADVVKGIYHETVFLVARLCGGFDHMRFVTAEHREYDHDYDRKQAVKKGVLS
jgi:hypothetical protein